MMQRQYGADPTDERLQRPMCASEIERLQPAADDGLVQAGHDLLRRRFLPVGAPLRSSLTEAVSGRSSLTRLCYRLVDNVLHRSPLAAAPHAASTALRRSRCCAPASACFRKRRPKAAYAPSPALRAGGGERRGGEKKNRRG